MIRVIVQDPAYKITDHDGLATGGRHHNQRIAVAIFKVIVDRADGTFLIIPEYKHERKGAQNAPYVWEIKSWTKRVELSLLSLQ